MSNNDREKYEILPGLPPYGGNVISPKGMDYWREGIVIKFFTNEGEEWIANLAGGETEFTAVYPYLDDTLLVFAGGHGYIIDPDKKEFLKSFGYGYSLAGTTNAEALVLYDFTNITVIQQDGETWKSRGVSIDGFRDMVIKDDVLSGFSFHPARQSTQDEWIPFSLDLATRTLTGGAVGRYSNSKPFPQVESFIKKTLWRRFIEKFK